MVTILSGRHGILVDDEDFDKVKDITWSVMTGYATFYAVRNRMVNGKMENLLMHRLIMNPTENMYVDHINGNGLDNRKENLRICTNAQNARNRRMSKRNTSGYRGVTWHKQTKKWVAQIHVNYKNHYLGLFENKEDAAEARRLKAIELHGEFAGDQQ